MSPARTDEAAEELARLRRRVAELEFALRQRPEVEAPFGLAERSALLDQAERDAQMGTWLWDLATNEVFWSPELYRILGYDPKTDHASYEAFFDAIHPDDRERTRLASEESVRNGGDRAFEGRVQWKCGQVRHVLLSGTTLNDAQGKPARVVGSILDVTDRRIAEERLVRSEALLKVSQRIARIGAWSLSLANNRLEWSEGLYHLLGVDPSIPPSHALFLKHVHPDDYARTAWQVEHMITDSFELPFEYRIVRSADGDVRRLQSSTIAVHDSSGALIGYFGAIMDVTERSHLEEQLRQAQKMEAIGRLAGGVAHDFNNLLTVILAYADILSKESPREEARAIGAAARSAADLTRRLLSFSRQAIVEPTLADLNEALEGGAQLLSRVIGEDVALEVKLEPGHHVVRAGSSQIHQVLMNLAVNARDAMPHGGRLVIRTESVTVGEHFRRAHPDCSEGRYVCVSIEDTGIGMDQHTKARIFEPFFTTKAPNKGTGLGLSTVFGIVRQAGGAIEVKSDVGRGSTFRLFFPEVDAASVRMGEPARVTKARTRTGTILVVEDNTEVAKLVTMVLQRAGYQVLTARRMSDAVALWDQHQDQIVLVVTDVVMPEGSGFKLSHHLRQARPSLRVLYMTGYASDALAKEDVPLDALDAPQLTKPFTPSMLLDHVAQALDLVQ